MNALLEAQRIIRAEVASLRESHTGPGGVVCASEETFAEMAHYENIASMIGWQPIETAPCDDTLALVYFAKHGGAWPIQICDLDHDSSPSWWAQRGATHWMPLPDAPDDPRYTLTDLGNAYRNAMQSGAKLNGEVKAGEDRND